MKRDRTLVTIFLLVVFLHAGLIFWAIAKSSLQPLLIPSPPLMVKTIALNPTPTLSQAPSHPPKKSPPQIRKTEAKKEFTKETIPSAPKKAAAVSTKPLAKTPPKQEPPAQKMGEDLLLNTARQALQNLQKPVTVEASKSFENPSSHAITAPQPYDQILGQRLHQWLRLPEYGEVTIQLTLNRDGTVAKALVVKAESETNRTYIQQQLPHLRFPTFGKQFPGEETHAFLLVLKNE